MQVICEYSLSLTVSNQTKRARSPRGYILHRGLMLRVQLLVTLPVNVERVHTKEVV